MYSIAIHGGAGTIRKDSITPEEEKLYLEGLEAALQIGYQILSDGRSALDAVEAAVISLEDNPVFNAGRGSVFNSEGIHEMEASVMWGKNLDAGAVCALRNVKNPIQLARLAMEKSSHLFLNGKGAEDFAREHDIAIEEDSYFFTTNRYDQLLDAKKNGRVQLDHFAEKHFGTVGAVAFDNAGNLAAATSTGGLTNKSYGRIGDSSVIGSGTYANNNSCAVSCTGDGEFFMRSVVAYDISCLMEYRNMSLMEACNLVVLEKLKKIGGEGGVIALDKSGNVAMVFNSEGMYRGYQKEGEKPFLAIYK
jgi:beta-aspartyl-peptidase (threonine type)